MENRDLPIVYLGFDWSYLKQRPQYLALELCKTRTVLYCDPTSFSVLTYTAKVLKGERVDRNLLRSTVEVVNDNLSVLTPPPLLPFGMYYGRLNWINQKLTRRLCSRACRERGFYLDEAILWCSFPLDVHFADGLGSRFLIYDCMDSYPDFYGGRRHANLRRLEEKLLGKADLVLASSEPLREKCGKLASRCELVPNGISEVFLEKQVHSRPEDLPEGPIVGYVGAVDNWFDWAWIDAIAENLERVNLVIIGPVRTPVPVKRANVFLLGAKPHEKVPAYLDHFDVGIIPFKVNPLTDAAHTIKIIEYFARGLPVVAPPLKALVEYQGVFLSAASRSEVVSGVRRALNQGRNPGARELAAGASWRVLGQRVQSLLPG